VFIVVFVLYTGNSIRYRFGSEKRLMPLWRLSVTRSVLLTACMAVVSIAMLQNHFILAGALAFAFAFVAWMAGRDAAVDKREKMDSFYRALARVDAGRSDQRFTGGPVGRWAGKLREKDYVIVAGRIADATKRSDRSADALLLEMYDGSGGRIDERGARAPEVLTTTTCAHPDGR
jgi:hypothetical protein